MPVYFDSLADFLAMGGHGLYVWLAYGTTLAVLVIYWLGLRFRHKRLLKTLAWRASVAERGEHSDGQTATGELTNESET